MYLIKQQKIMKLIPNIRKYFSFAFILGASEPDKCLRPYISIIRQLTKLKYNITSQDFRIRNSCFIKVANEITSGGSLYICQ